jgi:gamma-glutamyltranspeptidase / glutathione hydrolase
VLVQSVYQPFGAACADPRTGVLLNNRMLGFSATPGDPNCVMPGKRPRHTLCPSLVFADGAPRWALASPGGLSQTVTLTQVLGNLVDRGMRPAAATAAPRWCLSRGREVLIEPSYSGLPQALLGVVRVVDDPYSFGSAKVVAWETDGRLTASADGRRDAAVVAC